MTDQQLDILTHRLASLEGKVEQYRKTSRRWRTIGCCATAALVLLVLIGATDQEEKSRKRYRPGGLCLSIQQIRNVWS